MPPNQVNLLDSFPAIETEETKIRVAILGCGMMGQEHISYISGYSNLRIDFLCDPHEPSLTKAYQVLESFHKGRSLHGVSHTPQKLVDEQQLLDRVHFIDLLVIATPNYLHTPSLLKWAKHDIYILVEKPVAVSHEQLQQLENLNPTARIWVAMEYRYIPAIAKLQQLLPDIGDIKMITIRENRYPFLEKVGDWNRDIQNTGDTLVEKCCHFWDLFRLLTSQEIDMKNMRSMVQRGLNYKDEPNPRETPIIDSAYVIVPFVKPTHLNSTSGEAYRSQNTMGVLELCMYAEGSRHQEEIIVTGTKGRLEAFLPENKVYSFRRPNREEWQDRSVPPPKASPTVYDCSNLSDVHGIGMDLPTHGGYHYSSTSVEWYYLLEAMNAHKRMHQTWKPHVSLMDGIRAVEAGLYATEVTDEE